MSSWTSFLITSSKVQPRVFNPGKCVLNELTLSAVVRLDAAPGIFRP